MISFLGQTSTPMVLLAGFVSQTKPWEIITVSSMNRVNENQLVGHEARYWDHVGNDDGSNRSLAARALDSGEISSSLSTDATKFSMYLIMHLRSWFSILDFWWDSRSESRLWRSSTEWGFKSDDASWISCVTYLRHDQGARNPFWSWNRSRDEDLIDWPVFGQQ